MADLHQDINIDFLAGISSTLMKHLTEHLLQENVPLNVKKTPLNRFMS